MSSPLTILLFVILGLFLVIIAWLMLRLYRAERIKRDLETRFIELESKTNTLQLQTLEAKLNPHLFKYH